MSKRTSTRTNKKKPAAVRSIFTGGSQTASNQIVTPETSMQVSAVFACVKVLSESVASLPLHLYRQDGEQKYKDVNHYLYDLLHSRPNSWMSSYEFKSLLVNNLCLSGNFYARKLYNGAGKLGELIPLNPKVTKAKWNKAETEVVYEFRDKSGKSYELPSEEVFHVKGLSMDGLNGLNPIAAARESIGLSMASEKHAAALFANGGRPSGVISFKNPIDEPGKNQFENDWNAKFSNGGHGKLALLEADEVSYTPLGLSNDDAQYMQIRQFQLSEIARMFRVQPHLIGDLSKATFSNIEQQSLDFVIYTLTPWIVNIEQAICRSLFTEKERRTHFVKFSVDALLRGDTKSRYEAFNLGFNGGYLCRDEIREMEDRNPLPNGEGKVFLQPLNMTKVGEDSKKQEPKSEEPKDNTDKLDKARSSLLKLLNTQVSRAMKKDSDTIRKAITTGNVDTLVTNFRGKRPEFLGKLIREVGETYCGVFCQGISDDRLDEIVAEFSDSVYDQILQELKDEPNPGIVADKLESERQIKAIGENFFTKINQRALC